MGKKFVSGVALLAAILIAISVLSHQTRKKVEPQVDPDRPPVIVAHWEIQGHRTQDALIWYIIDEVQFGPYTVSRSGQDEIPGVRRGQVINFWFAQWWDKGFSRIWLTNQGWIVTPQRSTQVPGEISVRYVVP